MVFWIDGKYVEAALDEVKRELGPKLEGSDRGTLIDIANALASISSLAGNSEPLVIVQVDNLNNLHGFYLELVKPVGFTKQHALQISNSSENMQVGQDHKHVFLRVKGYFSKPNTKSKRTMVTNPIDTNDLVLWTDVLFASPQCHFRSSAPVYAELGGTEPATKMVKALVNQGVNEPTAYALVGKINNDAAHKIVEIVNSGLLPTWCSNLRTSLFELTADEIGFLSSR